MTELATHMRVSPSVISDYEAGRRTSPGIKTIHRLVDALLEIDQRTGQKLTKRFQEYSDVIPSMRDWAVGVRAADFLRKIDGKLLTQKLNTRRIVNGYTVIDSMKAITTLDASDYLQIYGSTSERALFFTGVKYGRSPMIAIKAHPLKPRVRAWRKSTSPPPRSARSTSAPNPIRTPSSPPRRSSRKRSVPPRSSRPRTSSSRARPGPPRCRRRWA